MSISKEIAKLERSELKPVYFLHGDETYFPALMARKILDIAIPDFEKGFNEFVLFGKDLNVGAVLGNARRFPMMADKQLVLVKDAELIQDIGQKEAQGMLESYAKNPLESTILVLLFGKSMDERKTWIKAFSEKGLLLGSKKLYDNQVPDFIVNVCHEKSFKISMKAALLLFEHIGNNLESIVNEVDKLILNLPPQSEIDANAIEKYVGISKDYNVFELQKSLTNRDLPTSMKIVNYFADNQKDHPLQPIILILYNFFSKVLLVHAFKNLPDASVAAKLGVNPYFVKDYVKASRNFSAAQVINAISIIRKTDEISKGINTGSKSSHDIYKDLIIGLLS